MTVGLAPFYFLGYSINDGSCYDDRVHLRISICLGKNHWLLRNVHRALFFQEPCLIL